MNDFLEKGRCFFLLLGIKEDEIGKKKGRFVFFYRNEAHGRPSENYLAVGMNEQTCFNEVKLKDRI